MQQRLVETGLLKGKTVAIDGTTLEANAAMRSILRHDTGESYHEFLTRLAKASGIETPAGRPGTAGPQAEEEDGLQGRVAAMVATLLALMGVVQRRVVPLVRQPRRIGALREALHSSPCL